MTEKDYTEKRLENFNDVFSDIINILVFDGQEEVKETDLKKLPDYYPMITIGLYFSDNRWSGITSLRDKLSLPESMKGFVPEYRVNMIEVAYLTDKQVSSFKSDFKYVAEYFVENRRQKEGAKPRFNFSPKHVKHVEEFLELMKAITGNEKVYDTYLDAIQNEGGAIQIMESIFDRYEAKGMAIGEIKGEIKGTIKVYYDELKLSPAEINQRIIERFHLNPNDAEKYIEETLKPV